MEKKLAILLDPEKANLNALSFTSESHPDYIFVGGSTGGDTTEFVQNLKSKISNLQSPIPIVLFPGNSSQFTPEADAVLFLSLLSGNNPEYIVGQQIKSARAIYESHINFIPTAYILIDGGVETSTMRVTGTQPLDPNDVNTIIDTSIAAELMGKKAIYLEAGSGAITPASTDIIKDAGADIVVIGNHFESHPEDLAHFLTVKRSYSETVLQCSGLTAQRSEDERYMRIALSEAHKALSSNEIPIGCVIVSNNQVIGRGHNLTETLADVTAHAEVQAITAASQTLGGKYMPDATLYVTVEPCAMCAGAIGWAQIKRIVYGAPDPKRGYQTYAPRAFHPKATVTAGVLENECRALIQEFFKNKR